MNQKIIYGLFVSFLLVLGIGTVRGRTSVVDYFELKQSRDVLSKTVGKLERENQELKEEITKIKKSKNYAKKILRDKYHVLEEDESILFFPD